MGNLIKKVQHIIFQYSLAPRGSKIILGISGGPDSVCLLNIFAKLQKKYDWELIVAHVNYGLRGKDSVQDEKFVKNLSEKFGLEFILLKPKVATNSSEEKLRKIRYDFFEKVRRKNNYNSVAVAHNLDDQVETFLMRIIRGTGLGGLTAMKYKNGKIIRPLLGTTRQEILEFLKANEFSYRLDKTNKQSVYLRNKIRNKLIPYLEKNFYPQIKKTIFNSIESINEDYDLISEMVKKELEKNKNLSISKLLVLHPALQKRILRKALSQKKNNKREIESAHINELIKILKSTKGKNQIMKLGNLKIERKQDKLVITNN